MSVRLIHSVAEKGFKNSSLYDHVRPSYSHELVEFLLKKTGVLGKNSDREKTVVELGAGTGLFTRVMMEVLAKHNLNKKVRIVAVEPLACMCEKLHDQCPGIEIKQNAAENTGLSDRSVSAVIAAQSFHWFANQKGLAEIYRILIPGGNFGIIWKNRDRSVCWVDKIDKMVQKMYELSATPTTWNDKWKDEVAHFGKFSPIQSDLSFTSEQEGDLNFILDRYMTVSIVATSNDEEKKAFLNKVKTILKETGKSVFVLPYIDSIYWMSKI